MKTLLKLSVFCASALAALPMTAAAEGELGANFEATINSSKPDSAAHFRFGKREVIFDGNDIHFIRDRFEDDYFEENNETETGANWSKNLSKHYHSHIESFGIGIAGYGSDKFSTTVADSASYLDLNGNRSIHLGFYFVDAGVRLGTSRFGLCSGLGVKWDLYSLSAKNIVLNKDQHKLEYQYDTTNYVYEKSKMRVVNLALPVALEWQAHSWGNFYAMVGVEGNLRIGTSTKMVTDKGRKIKNKSDLHINTFSCDVFARVGYDGLGVFISANLTPLFKDGKGPELYPFSAGLSFSF